MRDDPSRSYTRKWAAQEPSFLTFNDGTRLRYLRMGEGPPLLLMHTVRTQLDLFQRLIPKLVEHYAVHAIDLPGFGWSDIVPGASYTEPFLRSRVKDVIQALQLRDVTLAGESIGAVLALTIAAELTVETRRVVAFNAYDYRPGLERANLLASLIIKNVRVPVLGPVFARMETRALLKGILRGGVDDPKVLTDDFLDELMRVGKRPGYASAARSVYRSLPSFVAARSLYAAVRAPVTLVYGDRDWSKPAERRANAERLAGCAEYTIPRCGHFATLENPDECARILTQA